MLTRVRRKISKQLSHENISEKPENPEESPQRKQSTAERKQSTAERKKSTAERKLSRAERKRSTAEQKHARSKSLESGFESNPEVEYLMYEIQGLQAEVNSLRSQLEEETKRSKELKSLKTQQVCALTFKLANAIRQREKAEENAAKAMAEIEKFQSQVTGINGCVNVITSCEKREEPDKFRKICEESESSEKLPDENVEKEEDCHVSDNEDPAKSNDTTALCSRKAGVVISQNELQRMMEGEEEKLVDSGYCSCNGEHATACKILRDAETQTLVQEGKSFVDQGTQGDAVESYGSHQTYQELVSQEFARIQEELGEVKGNMSMVHALNQRLSEDLQSFTKTYELLQGQKSGRSPGSEKHEQNNQLSATVSPASDMVCFVSEGHDGNDEVDQGICEPQIEVKTCAEKLETFEEKVRVQAAEVKYAESEWEQPSSENGCGATMEKVFEPQEVKVSQEVLEDYDMNTKAELKEVEEGQVFGKIRVNDAGFHYTKEMKVPEVATVQQMEVLKEQFKIAMMEIDQLRMDNNDMRRELRQISASTGNELLIKTTKFTDQLLREMRQRETSVRSQGNPLCVGKYPFTLEPDNCWTETEEVSPPKTATDTQCPNLSAQHGSPWTVRGLEQSSRPSLPLRLLGNRRQEMTETLDDMTERPQPVQVPHSSDPLSSSFVLKHRYQRPFLKGEPHLSSYSAEKLGFEPMLGSDEGAFVNPEKLGERGLRSGSSTRQLVERRNPGFLDEERSKPLDFSKAIRNSYSLRVARKPFSVQNTNDYIQRHIVRSSDYIAKLRDLRPEELSRPQED